MPIGDASRQCIDGRPVADVADLDLGADVGRELAQSLLASGDQDAAPALLRELARQGGTDPAGAAGDDGDALVPSETYFFSQIFTLRLAVAVAPPASVTTVPSVWTPPSPSAPTWSRRARRSRS